MTIDSFYEEVDKNNFYIGRVSQVYRDYCVVQVENLSILRPRSIYTESLIPNTINYLVVVDSAKGIFLGEVFQTKVSSSEKLHNSTNYGKPENISPEINIDIIGVMTYRDSKFKLSEFRTVGVSEKVYLANRNIIEKYLESVEITRSTEKSLLPFATFLNRYDMEISLKASTLFNHHLFVVGATNSGKSTSALSVLDKVIKSRKKVIIIDPTGEYMDSFSPQEVTKLILGKDTTISPGKLTMRQWSMLFETNSVTQNSVLAEAIQSLRYQKKKGLCCRLEKVGKSPGEVQQELATLTEKDSDFNVSFLSEQIAAESVSESSRKPTHYEYDTFKVNMNSYLIQKVKYQLSHSNFLKFFSHNPNSKDLIEELYLFLKTPNSSLYVNTSMLGLSDGIGGMVIDLICSEVMGKNAICPFVFFIDEVHRYTKSQSKEEFYEGLTRVAREGRKKGIFLFLTSQNPQDVSPTLLSQIGTLLIHRLTHNDEIRAIKNHLDDYSLRQIRKLNQGESVLTSINLMQNIFLKIIKCDRRQDNETPFL